MTNAPNDVQRILIIHPDPIIAIGLKACLSDLHRLDIEIGSAGSSSVGFSVVVCDEAGSRSTVLSHDAAVVVFERQPRSLEIRRALQRGVMGYVVEGSGPSEIAAAVEAATMLRHFLCPLCAREIATDFANEALTDREGAVLALLARGLSNKAIAKDLDIAIGTVKAHVRSILAKLDAHSRTHAASIALARGFIQSD